jgi:hypothetical protein
VCRNGVEALAAFNPFRLTLRVGMTALPFAAPERISEIKPYCAIIAQHAPHFPEHGDKMSNIGFRHRL